MEINKGSRHQKIIGDFGEQLVCNWLSRSGFEVSIVDDTGIDLSAYSPSTERRLGITLKSMTRPAGREVDSVIIFRKHRRDREKLRDACDAFACEPWIAVYVEVTSSADLYLTSLKNYDGKYRGKERRASEDWKMTESQKREYAGDSEVKHIQIEFHDDSWWE